MKVDVKLRSTYKVSFDSRQKSRRPSETVTRIPRVTQLLALAHKIERMIRDGLLKDLADAARTAGVSRARITQIMNLLLLASVIQEEIACLPPIANGRERITERQLRMIVAEPLWERQLAAWRKLHE